MTPTPGVRLEPMRQEAFEPWYEEEIRGYAEDHVAAGNWPEEGAVERSRREFETLLPDGLATAGQHLFSIVAEDGTTVGALWLGPRNGATRLFIWDIVVWPEWRGRGYGRAALEALDAWARANGYDRIGLHVFGSNATARHLYASMGYVDTDVMMEKRL